MTKIKMGYLTNLVNFAIIIAQSFATRGLVNFHKPIHWYKRARNGSLPHSRPTRPLGMVAPDTAGQSETHRDTKEREPVKLGLHATVNPDTLPFTYAKDKHALTFTVRERQEVSVTYKGADAGPIPLSAKDRITVVFAHALDPRKSTAALWDLHKPFAHLSYAESREYVRVLFVDETGRLAVSAAHEKSRGGLDQRSIQGRSITMKPEPPRRVSAERDMTNEPPTAEEKSNNADNEADAPPPVRAAPAKTPRSPGAAARSKQSAAAAAAARTPSPARVTPSPKETKRSPASGRSRDPIQSILSTVAKDASAIVCVQYPGNERDEDSTVAEEKTRDENTNKNDTKKVRDMDTDGRRDEVLRKKMDEMRRREDEEKTRRKRDEERKEERKKSEEERKRKDEEREERKRKEEEREERKKDEEREEKRRAEEEDRRKKADEEAAEEEKAKPRRTSSNEDVKQEQANEEQSSTPSARRRRVLGADGHYHDDDSRYLDEEIRRKNASVRMLKKGARTASRDNSAEEIMHLDQSLPVIDEWRRKKALDAMSLILSSNTDHNDIRNALLSLDKDRKFAKQFEKPKDSVRVVGYGLLECIQLTLLRLTEKIENLGGVIRSTTTEVNAEPAIPPITAPPQAPKEEPTDADLTPVAMENENSGEADAPCPSFSSILKDDPDLLNFIEDFKHETAEDHNFPSNSGNLDIGNMDGAGQIEIHVNSNHNSMADDSMPNSAKKKAPKKSGTEMKCHKCEFRTHYVREFASHLQHKHSTSAIEDGVALRCECGHESYVATHHSIVCPRANFTVIPKPKETTTPTTPKCILCDMYPKSAYGYAFHLHHIHKTKLKEKGYQLKCACGDLRDNITAINKHAKMCKGKEFTLHKASKKKNE
ncbi:hypothetical protein PRIPAC_89054 [Pristionchus pacificus]|uniref:Uncharacterized protein n=1 Tax=Pristionchus pacificus TaxID=54126 RepID=A0A2A6B698_PRIPA|nr:hypothetical protein PRIPAC_89054 [Pristionchus pacificus]|eukprot:PDM61388.1 hypothetical protein PRIPAC_50830 [Pristionchus pacificus]